MFNSRLHGYAILCVCRYVSFEKVNILLLLTIEQGGAKPG